MTRYGNLKSEIDNHPVLPLSKMITNNISSGGIVLPQVASATLLLSLQADIGVTQSAGIVSVWADQSGNGNNFSQSNVLLRPTFDDNAVYFGGFAQLAYMTCPSFADNLDKFALFAMAKFDTAVNDDTTVISKETTDQFGWELGFSQSGGGNTTSYIGIKGDTNYVMLMEKAGTGYVVTSAEWLGSDTGHAFVNGDNTGETPSGGLTGSFSNSEDVILGGLAAFLPDDGFSGWMKAVMLYHITDYTNWNLTDRDAIRLWIASRYP